MKHNYKFLIIALIAVGGLVASCKKENTLSNLDTVKITAADSTKTITITKGQAVALTLANPGDGGYVFNTPLYDTTVLHLDSHNHILPTTNSASGDFGYDTWLFSSTKSGTTTLKITASRTVNTIVLFSNTIKVN